MTTFSPETTDVARLTSALRAMRDPDRHFDGAEEVWYALGKAHRDQLNQLLNQGPVWDGNVLSKSHRSDLIDWGLATRCCFRGEQGYTAATYTAYSVFRAGADAPFAAKSGSAG